MKNPLSFPARLVAYPAAIAAAVTLLSHFRPAVVVWVAAAMLIPMSIELLMGRLGLT
jgi:hypothetical protein